MTKFTLNVELKDEKYCNECPCLGFFTTIISQSTNYWCSANKYSHEVILFAKNGIVKRPDNCPLKPVQTCESCEYYNIDRMHCTYSKPTEYGNIFIAPEADWSCADWEAKVNANA